MTYFSFSKIGPKLTAHCPIDCSAQEWVHPQHAVGRVWQRAPRDQAHPTHRALGCHAPRHPGKHCSTYRVLWMNLGAKYPCVFNTMPGNCSSLHYSHGSFFACLLMIWSAGSSAARPLRSIVHDDLHCRSCHCASSSALDDKERHGRARCLAAPLYAADV